MSKKVANKHVNLKSEDHAQSKAARRSTRRKIRRPRVRSSKCDPRGSKIAPRALKCAPRAAKSSRDVERKIENKHVHLKSEDHAQNKAARRSPRRKIRRPQVRTTLLSTKNRLHPKGNPKSSRTTPKDSRAAHTMNSSQAQPARGRSLRGGGGLRATRVLDNPQGFEHF